MSFGHRVSSLQWIYPHQTISLGCSPHPSPEDHVDGMGLPTRRVHVAWGTPGGLRVSGLGWLESLKQVSLCLSLPALSRNAFVYTEHGPSCTKRQTCSSSGRGWRGLPRTQRRVLPSLPSLKLIRGNRVSVLILSLFLLFFT